MCFRNEEIDANLRSMKLILAMIWLDYQLVLESVLKLKYNIY